MGSQRGDVTFQLFLTKAFIVVPYFVPLFIAIHIIFNDNPTKPVAWNVSECVSKPSQLNCLK